MMAVRTAVRTADCSSVPVSPNHPGQADRHRVVPGVDAMGGQVIITKPQLVEELGEDVTDVEAEVLAAGLTARLPR